MPCRFPVRIARALLASPKKREPAVSSGNSNQITGGLRAPERLGVSDNLIKILQQLMLLVDQSFRITDDVYEQDMGNLQSKIGFRFGHGIQIALLIEER